MDKFFGVLYNKKTNKKLGYLNRYRNRFRLEKNIEKAMVFGEIAWSIEHILNNTYNTKIKEYKNIRNDLSNIRKKDIIHKYVEHDVELRSCKLNKLKTILNG